MSAPTTSGHHQTLLDLIYSVRGLAQTVEFMHSDLRRLLEEGNRGRDHAVERLRELVEHNTALLPIAISDRLEVPVRRLESGIDEKMDVLLGDILKSLNEVRSKLWDYIQTKEKEASASKTDSAVPVPTAHEVTGKIEIRKDGQVNLSFHTEWVKKVITVGKYIILFLAVGGGIAGIIQAIRSILEAMQ